MRNLLRGDHGIGSQLLGLFGDVIRAIGAGLGRMVAIVLCGALIGSAGGFYLYIAEDWQLAQALVFGAIAGAALALLAIIVVTFASTW